MCQKALNVEDWTVASQHIAITVREIASSLDKTPPSLLLPHAMDTFLCRQCFTSVEKLASLRNEVSKLELTIVRQLKCSGEMQGLYSSLTPTQRNTAEAHDLQLQLHLFQEYNTTRNGQNFLLVHSLLVNKLFLQEPQVHHHCRKGGEPPILHADNTCSRLL